MRAREGDDNISFHFFQIPVNSVVVLEYRGSFISPLILFTSTGTGINKWVTTAAVSLESTFSGATEMNNDLTKWDVRKVATMANTFFEAVTFTGAGINTWITTNLATLAGTFKGASKMNADVGGWAVTKVTTLHNTFKDATKFTGTERKNRETERKRARKCVRARQRARARDRDPTAFPSIAGEGNRGKWHRHPARQRPVEEILYGVAHTVLVRSLSS